MNEVPASIKAAAEPQVNLLPPEVEARRARGRQRGLVGFVFFAFIVALGFAVYWAYSQDSAAQKELQVAIDKEAELQAQIDTYDYVVAMEEELRNARNARTFVGATELDFFRVIADIGAALPSGVSIDDMTWTVLSITGDTPEDVSPFAKPDIGMVSIKGEMKRYISGADLEDALNEVPGIARARVVTEQRQDADEGVFYSFDATARLTALAFSGRFSTDWLKLDSAYEAGVIIGERLAEAEAAVEDAEAAYEAGEIDEAALTEARDDLDLATADFNQLLAFAEVFDAAEREVAWQEEAVSYGDDGAEADLVIAEARLAELDLILTPLVQKIHSWDEEADDLAMIEARIAAAEEYVAFCEKRVEDAQAAVQEEEEGAGEALAYAQKWLSRAQRGLLLEQSSLAAAEEDEQTTRADLDEAMAAAAIIAPVHEETTTEDTTGGDES